MTPNVLSALANCVTAVAAMAASYAAISGLRSWRKQQEWRDDVSIAREIFVATYEYQQGITALSYPAIFPSETALSDDEHAQLSHAEADRAGLAKAYTLRHQAYLQRRNVLLGAMAEAEAIWGAEVNDLATKIHAIDQEISRYLRLFYRSKTHIDGRTREAAHSQMKELRDVLDCTNTEEGSFFSDVATLLASLREFLRSKIGRNL